MRYLDTIFKGLCVLILVVSTYKNRDKLLKAFHSSPTVSKSIFIAGMLCMILVISIITIAVIRF